AAARTTTTMASATAARAAKGRTRRATPARTSDRVPQMWPASPAAGLGAPSGRLRAAHRVGPDQPCHAIRSFHLFLAYPVDADAQDDLAANPRHRFRAGQDPLPVGDRI